MSASSVCIPTSLEISQSVKLLNGVVNGSVAVESSEWITDMSVSTKMNVVRVIKNLGIYVPISQNLTECVSLATPMSTGSPNNYWVVTRCNIVTPSAGAPLSFQVWLTQSVDLSVTRPTSQFVFDWSVFPINQGFHQV